MCLNPDPTKYYKIKNAFSMLVLGINNSTAINAAVKQEIERGTDSQIWKFLPVNAANNTYRIVNSYSGLALTNPSNTNAYQALVNTNRTDQVFQMQVDVGYGTSCYITAFPYVNRYVTVSGCYSTTPWVIGPTSAFCESGYYLDSQHFSIIETSMYNT